MFLQPMHATRCSNFGQMYVHDVVICAHDVCSSKPASFLYCRSRFAAVAIESKILTF